MTLEEQISALAVRVAEEINALRAEIAALTSAPPPYQITPGDIVALCL